LRETTHSAHKLEHLCTQRRLPTDGFHASELENIYRSRKWRSGSKRQREMAERGLSTRILEYLKPFARNVRGAGRERNGN
jgi:hypothetical protein